MISSDHGEAFGELGVYADHQAADEATCHIPMIVRWPGIEPRSYEGLHYHLDAAATVVDLAGVPLPPGDWWDGISVKSALESGTEAGRDHLVLSQGAWACQRSVRWDNWLYSKTWHDGYHGWPEETLFDIAADPHEQTDLFGAESTVANAGAETLATWTETQLDRALGDRLDPMETVLAEGGPYHCRRHLPAYLERLRETGRSGWQNDFVHIYQKWPLNGKAKKYRLRPVSG